MSSLKYMVIFLHALGVIFQSKRKMFLICTFYEHPFLIFRSDLGFGGNSISGSTFHQSFYLGQPQTF